VIEGVLAPGAFSPVDGVLERARDRAVVVGGDEEDGVGPAATRYAKRAAYYRAEITIAATVLWLRNELQDTP
jgi:hypothetical protein